MFSAQVTLYLSFELEVVIITVRATSAVGREGERRDWLNATLVPCGERGGEEGLAQCRVGREGREGLAQ